MRYHDIQPHQRDYKKWRLFSWAGLPELTRKRFERLRKGVMHYLDTGKARRAASIAECSQTYLLDLVARCVSNAPDGMPQGFIALVSGQRLEGYTRRLKLPAGMNAGKRGAAGSFNAILAAHSHIEAKLIECIKNGGGEKVRSKKPMVAAVFRVFLREVAKVIGPNDYPNNTESKARRSVERFVKAYQLKHLEVLGAWQGEEAVNRLNVGNGHHSFELATVPFAVVGIDAHEIHCIGTVVIDGPGGPRAIPIARLWIDAACDEGSRAVIGYSVAIGEEISSDDLIAAIRRGTVSWERREPRIGEYVYRKGAGLPYGVVDGLGPCRPACIKLDNATAHYAKNIQQNIRRSLGCTLTWGPVATWWTNAITERFFRTLEEHGFQILQSSTGSNTQDRHRGDFVKEATTRWIRFDDLIDLIDVLIANYNAANHKGLGGISPLEALAGHLASADMMMQRPQPPRTALSPQLGVVIKSVRVRGSYANGRRPYFELDEVRYTSPELANRFDLIGKRAIAHVDGSDLRQIDLYTEAGESLGTTEPQKAHWRETKHSSGLRKSINKAVRRGYIKNMQGVDPIAQYIALNAKKAYESYNPKKPKVSKPGTRAAAASQETGKSVSAQPPAQEGSAPAMQARPVGRMPKHLRSTDWSRN